MAEIEYHNAPIPAIPWCEYCDNTPTECKECLDCQYEYCLELAELTGSFEEVDQIYR